MIFYTSDMMFGNTLIATQRHCSSVIDLSIKVIEGWNSIVDSNDDVYILGGIGDYGYLQGLKGNKYLVMGASDTDVFNAWRSKFKHRNLELDKEIYSKYLKERYDIKKVTYSGSLLKKLSTGDVVCLTTDATKRKRDMFNLYGCVGDFQKMVSDGINVGCYVNCFYPVSETEISFYLKHLNSLL